MLGTYQLLPIPFPRAYHKRSADVSARSHEVTMKARSSPGVYRLDLVCPACSRPVRRSRRLKSSPPPTRVRRGQGRPGLPRVLLIGDSISIGYTVPTRKLLQGKANVHRIPENGGATTTGLQEAGQVARRRQMGRHPLQLGPARHQARQGRQASGAARPVREEPARAGEAR